MATKSQSHLESKPRHRHPHLSVVVREFTAEDMRREHEEALREGTTHPGWVRAYHTQDSCENASANFEARSTEEMLQECFETFAQTRNNHMRIH